jgi:hypothetical protein
LDYREDLVDECLEKRKGLGDLLRAKITTQAEGGKKPAPNKKKVLKPKKVLNGAPVVPPKPVTKKPNAPKQNAVVVKNKKEIVPINK